MFQRMTEKCFKKCIGKPGSTLDNSEQVCRAMHAEVCRCKKDTAKTMNVIF